MQKEVLRALGQIPSGQFILTAAYNGARSGVLVEWVQQCATSPPMVMAAVSTTMPVVPLIRDSHHFALCQIGQDDRLLGRKFAAAPDHGDDPFDTMPTLTAPSGAPVLRRALCFLDCEVVRHIDLETDYGLYVGHVRHARILNGGLPAVLIRGNGQV